MWFEMGAGSQLRCDAEPGELLCSWAGDKELAQLEELMHFLVQKRQ